METKDYIYGFGIIATLIVGFANLIYTRRATRRADFIRVVTSERVKWIESLRQNVSKYAGKVHTWSHIRHSDEKQATQVLGEIDILAYQIRLQLNPNESPDKEIEALLLSLPRTVSNSSPEYASAPLEELTRHTKKLIKKEWEKVKEESEKGRIKNEA